MAQIPSKFILNSDYLSIAQIGKNDYTLTIGGGTLVVNGSTNQGFDFSIPAQKGAIDRIMISKDGGEYMVGAYMVISLGSPGYVNFAAGHIRVSRSNPNTLHVQFELENMGTTSFSYPSMTFKIKVASFKPPNVF